MTTRDPSEFTYAGGSLKIFAETRQRCKDMHTALYAGSTVSPANVRGNLLSAALSAVAAGVDRETLFAALTEDYDYAVHEATKAQSMKTQEAAMVAMVAEMSKEAKAKATKVPKAAKAKAAKARAPSAGYPRGAT